MCATDKAEVIEGSLGSPTRRPDAVNRRPNPDRAEAKMPDRVAALREQRKPELDQGRREWIGECAMAVATTIGVESSAPSSKHPVSDIGRWRWRRLASLGPERGFQRGL